MPKLPFEYIILGLIFLVSRTVFYACGVQFDASGLESYVQIIDPELLRTRFLESIYYLHSQPPLFNCFLGLVLKLFPSNYVPVFHVCFLVLGLVFMFSLYLLMKRLKVNVYVNMVLTTLFMISPAVILYENWLFYSYPVAVTLCLSALYLHKFIGSGRTKDAFIFFCLLMTLILLRSLFHLLWFVAVVLLLIALKKTGWRQLVITALIPFAIALSWHIKNAVVFRQFTTSSTLVGAVIARMSISYLTEDEREQLIREGKIRKITLVEPGRPKTFNPDYAKYFPIPQTGIPVLDKPYWGNDRERVNLNSLYALQLSKVYAKDGLYVLQRFPHAYLKALRRSFFLYLFPGPTDIKLSNRHFIKDYEQVYNFMFAHLNKANVPDIQWYSSPHYAIRWDWLSRLSLAAVALYYIGLNIFAVAAVWKSGKRGDDAAFTATLAFIAMNIFYVTILISALEITANNRYRFGIDAFYVVLCGLLLTQCLKKGDSALYRVLGRKKGDSALFWLKRGK